MSGIRIPGCYTHPWLLYASLVVIHISGCYYPSLAGIRLPDRYTHPWLLCASLTVIRIPGCYRHP